MSASSSRAILRIARRNILQSRWRSLLVAFLVMLPVAAMVGASSVLQAATPTAERTVTHRLGTADLLVAPNGAGATIEALRAGLPPGSRVEPFMALEGRLVLPGREVSVILRSMDIDGLARGMLTMVDGRAPRNPGEVAISAPVASLAGVAIGAPITLTGLGSPTVVGLVEDPFDLRLRVVLQDVSPAVAAQARQEVSWLVGLPPGADASGFQAGQSQALASTPDSAFQVTTRAQETMQSESPTATIVVLGGLALLEAALVASAAFAVSIRRRQRELGLLAATGAEPRQLAGVVIADGLLLGGLGALVGAVVGLAGALAVSPWLDQLTDRRNPSVGIDPVMLIVAGGIGLVAALLAATVPGWTAARLPVLAALSGRRPAQAPARRTLSIGIVLIGVAIALTGIGATVRYRDIDGSTATLSLLLLLGGAVIGTLGFGACSPWLLERLEGPAARLPLSSRIALRDTARARSRNGPIVTAVLASVAATVALSAFIASNDAYAAARWQPWLEPDQILVQGEGVNRVGPEAAQALGAIAAGPVPFAARDDRYIWISPGRTGDPDPLHLSVTIGDNQLLKAMGDDTATSDLAAGGVVLFLDKASSVTRATVHVMDNADVELDSVELPARVVVTGIDQGGDLPEAVVSPETAARFGVAASPVVAGPGSRYVVRLAHPVTETDLARAAAIAAQYPDTQADAALGPTRSGDAFRMAWLIASLLFALSVTGVAVALGEAESRPEQRTLLALGADPRVRRRIAAGRAAVIAALAGVLAVPAGLLPVWGLLLSRGSPLVVPVPEVLAALLVLPLLAVAATFVLARPIPSWSAFRGAGS